MEYRRKFERIILSPIDNAFAKLHLDGDVHTRPIHNISYRGMGLITRTGDNELLKRCKEVPITLEIEGTIAETQGSIVHFNDNIVGVHFMALTEVSRRIISAYLDPRYLGSQLREIPREMVSDEGRRVFFGPNSTRLFVTTSKKKSGLRDRVELVFNVNFVRIDEQGVISSGSLDEAYMADEAKAPSGREKGVVMHTGLDMELVVTAMKLLRYAPLDMSLRSRVEKKIQAVLGF